MSRTLHDQVLQQLGTQILGGELGAGSILLADEIAEEFAVSRSVIREALRVLQSLGMVTATKRVGIKVLPDMKWNLYDPLIIRWRLTVGSSGGQLRSLTELRSAIEPKAAELAAEHRSDRVGAKLIELAVEMRETGRVGDLKSFLDLDIKFHRVVLEASGNEMFTQLGDVVAEVLTARTEQGLMPHNPHEDALAQHISVAEAIWSRDSAAAYASMDQIMRRTAAEVRSTWSYLPRPSILAESVPD